MDVFNLNVLRQKAEMEVDRQKLVRVVDQQGWVRTSFLHLFPSHPFQLGPPLWLQRKKRTKPRKVNLTGQFMPHFFGYL